MRRALLCTIALLGAPAAGRAQRYVGPDGKLRVALAEQPFLPNGTSPGPKTMAAGGIQEFLAAQRASVRVDEAAREKERSR